MPSTKNVNNQGNEHNSLCLASFTAFPHFDIKGVLDSFFSFPGDLSNKLLLTGVDNRDIKRSIFAIALAQKGSSTLAGRSSLQALSFRGCSGES